VGTAAVAGRVWRDKIAQATLHCRILHGCWWKTAPEKGREGLAEIIMLSGQAWEAGCSGRAHI
jgi:hypothetical protein